jgi:heptosyltransferase-2
MTPVRNWLRTITRTTLFAPASIWLQSRLLILSARLASRTAPTAGKPSQRILVVKLDGIGDYVLVTPFLRELRHSFPAAWITLVTNPLVESLARTSPHINEIVVMPRTAPGLGGVVRHWIDWLTIAWQRLLPLRPTLAILPRWDSDIYDAYALLALSGAARRVSYSCNVSAEKHARNRGADLLLTDAVRGTAQLHEVERNLDLLRSLEIQVADSALELQPAADGAALAETLLGERSAGTLIALCPFSAELVKDWPFENFLTLVAGFTAHRQLTFALFASRDYSTLADEPQVRALPNLVMAAGRFSLDETAALLSRCEIVVSVDTGLAHVAAALHRPLVLISGQTATRDPGDRYSAARFGPWQADCTIVAPPAGTGGPRPIVGVSVAAVAAAISARLPLHR